MKRLVLALVLAGCATAPTEKDVVGVHASKNGTQLFKFYDDHTLVATNGETYEIGQWALLKDGRLKVVDAKGQEWLYRFDEKTRNWQPLRLSRR